MPPHTFCEQLLQLSEKDALAAQHGHVAMVLYELWGSMGKHRHHHHHGEKPGEVDQLFQCTSLRDVMNKAFTTKFNNKGDASLWTHVQHALCTSSNGLHDDSMTTFEASSNVRSEVVKFASKQLVTTVHYVLEGAPTQRSSTVFGAGAGRDAAIKRALMAGGLLTMDEQATVDDSEDNASRIPAEALAFAMSAPAEQWWQLLNCIICDTVDENNASRAVVLESLCLLAQMRLDKAYPWPAKGAAEGLGRVYGMMTVMAHLGLIFPYKHENKTPVFVVAPFLADAVFSHGAHLGGVPVAAPTSEDDTIITETNFQIYAYTTNRGTRALLRQFTTDETIVDEYFVCCRLSRDAFVEAVARGVTAELVIHFLTLKAHPVMFKDAAKAGAEGSEGVGAGSVVPQSICDQLHIWEAECKRVQFTDGSVLVSVRSATSLRILQDLLAAAGAHALFETQNSMVVSRALYEEVLAQYLE